MVSRTISEKIISHQATVVLTLLGATFILALPIHRWLSIGGTLCLVLGSLFWFTHRSLTRRDDVLKNLKTYPEVRFSNYLITFVFLMPLLSIGVSAILRLELSLPDFDMPSRLVLGFILFLWVFESRFKPIDVLATSMAIGLIATVALVPLIDNCQQTPLLCEWNPHRVSPAYLHPIYFGTLAALMAGFCLLAIRNVAKWQVVIYATGFLAGMVLVILSGSRGSWITITVIIVVWLLARLLSREFSVKLIAILGVMGLLIGISFHQTILHRVQIAATEFKEYSPKVDLSDSSVGLRLLMWENSLQLIKRKPWSGYGGDPVFKNNIERYSADLSQQGVSWISTYGPHNEFLNFTLRWGLTGILAYCSIYMLPMGIFLLRVLRDPENRVQRLGLGLTSGAFAAGVTHEFFGSMSVVTFYTVLLACVLGVSQWQLRYTAK